MLASVIVCTFNRASLLKRLLESLALQTASPGTFEIIVVDDGSTDDTPKVCRNMIERMPNMTYIPMKTNSGISAAGNRALEKASGEYILFTDDDCIPDPRWVEAMINVLQTAPIAAGTIITPTSPYFKLCHNIAQFYPFMPGQKSGTKDFIAGANMGFQSRVIRDIGKFDVDTIIPDTEYILRARQKGYFITYAPDAVITHDPPRVTFGAVTRYSALHASFTILLRHKYRELLHTPFILNSPLLILLAAPVIALKTTVSIFLGNLKLLRYVHTIPIIYIIKLAWCWGAARGLLGKKRKQTE
jgi:GT2 family glycosyltransferase